MSDFDTYNDALRRVRILVTAAIAGDVTVVERLVNTEEEPLVLCGVLLSMLTSTFVHAAQANGLDPAEMWAAACLRAEL